MACLPSNKSWINGNCLAGELRYCRNDLGGLRRLVRRASVPGQCPAALDDQTHAQQQSPHLGGNVACRKLDVP